jgi:hypothetical protein
MDLTAAQRRTGADCLRRSHSPRPKGRAAGMSPDIFVSVVSWW